MGRFICRDPSGEGSGLNLYAYCADNPVNNVDPTGLDFVVILNQDAVFGAGHIAEIFQDSLGGWAYYSFGPLSSGFPYGKGHMSSSTFTNLVDALNYAAQHDYTAYTYYKTSEAQDAAALAAATRFDSTTYKGIGHNCESLIAATMTAAGLNPNTSAWEPQAFFNENASTGVGGGFFRGPGGWSSCIDSLPGALFENLTLNQNVTEPPTSLPNGAGGRKGPD